MSNIFITFVLCKKNKCIMTKEERFSQIFSGLMFRIYSKSFDIESNKYTYKMVIFNDKELLFNYNSKTTYFWCSYHKYWEVFEREYSMNYQQINTFTKHMLEEGFKLKDVTPRRRLERGCFMLEEGFKLKDVTPLLTGDYIIVRLEEGFKLKDVTPESYSYQFPFLLVEGFKLKDVTPFLW